ncbi:hypothetical protein L9G74_18185 [Shewanella sp. C32]|uniref:Uncharacterized protein n=1 Tax=Shewanella electrica TaxID=515560 RepID=A0ABT2FPU2_9GAMM|nr:hypothetical protein [Shewanella electrica]MCH1926809.1 hypothetical protein [Shewanella electrica]MCS4558370.1 hypothetical protein [Shewanella electrica]
MDQFNKIEELGLADKYYGICDQHPLRIGEPIEKMPYKEVLKAAEGLIDIKKLKGPGTCYEVVGLPETVFLRFIVQGRTRVETHFGLSGVHVHSFAAMCLAAKEAAGKDRPKPPYPRPEAHSLDELIQVFTQLKNLALEFDRSIK